MVSKNTIIKDMEFCKELMDRLLIFTKENYDEVQIYNNGHTVIQSDIIRLRRELNNVKKKLDWEYKE